MRFAIPFTCLAAVLMVGVALADDKPKEKEKEKDKAKDVPALTELLSNIDKEPEKAKQLKGEKYSFVVEIASYSAEDHRNKAKVDPPFTVLLHLPRGYAKGDRIAVTATVKTITWEAKNKRINFDPVTIDEEISVTPPLFTAEKFMRDYIYSDVARNATKMKDAYEGRLVRLSGEIESPANNGPGPGAPAGGGPAGGPGPGAGPGPGGGPGGAGGPGGQGRGKGMGLGPPGGAGGGATPPPGLLPPGGPNSPPGSGGPGGNKGPSIGDYYLLKQQITLQNNQPGTALIIVRFADDADGKPVSPANHTKLKVEGVVESMSGLTITIKDAKIVK